MTTPPTGPGPGPGAGAGAGPEGPVPVGPRRAVLLAELAAELRAARTEHRRDVDALRTELTRLGELLADNADLLAQMIPRIATLDAELAALGDRVDNTGAGDPAEPRADWPSLTAEDAEIEWQALAAWIAEVLGPFYAITRGQLPDCWALHTRVVVELVWLRRCYLAADLPTAPPTAAADWHTRWLPAALNTIRDAISDNLCSPGVHRTAADGPHRQAPAPPGGRPVGNRDQVTAPRFWERYYRAGVEADLARRRRHDQALRAGAPPTPTSSAPPPADLDRLGGSAAP